MLQPVLFRLVSSHEEWPNRTRVDVRARPKSGHRRLSYEGDGDDPGAGISP